MFGSRAQSGFGLVGLSQVATVLLLAATAHASPAPSGLHFESRAAAATGFASSCTDIAYYGYCRIEANCTTDGSAVSKGTALQHTFLDLGQCIGYDTKSETLRWRAKTVAHWQSTYCEPCSQCSVDPKTTVMTCQCQYINSKNNHESVLTLSEHVSNTGGVLSCLNVAGDPDLHD